VSGTITVRNNNVTIRNFRVDGNGTWYPIVYESGHSGLVLEDGEVLDYDSAAVGGNFGNYTARRLEVHESVGDGFKADSNVLIESCWVYHLGTGAGSHADGVQISSGSNITIRGNFFDMPANVAGYESNANVFAGPDFGPISNLVVEGNWLDGGNYTLFIDATNVTVRDNLFGRDYNYGPSNMVGNSYTWTNNRWWDTLALIN